MTTPPLDPISESNESTVARCWDGIIPFRYACRIGIDAAKIKPQTETNARANQNDPVTARRNSTRPLTIVPRIRGDVRRLNRPLIFGAA
jgi:hypothetical protein